MHTCGVQEAPSAEATPGNGAEPEAPIQEVDVPAPEITSSALEETKEPTSPPPAAPAVVSEAIHADKGDSPRAASEPALPASPVADTSATAVGSRSAPCSAKAADAAAESFDAGSYGFFGAPSAGEAIEEGADAPPEEETLPEGFELGDVLEEEAGSGEEDNGGGAPNEGLGEADAAKAATSEAPTSGGSSAEGSLLAAAPGLDALGSPSAPLPTPALAVAASTANIDSRAFFNDPTTGKPATFFNQLRTGHSLEEGDLQSFRSGGGPIGGGLGSPDGGGGSAPSTGLRIVGRAGDTTGSLFGSTGSARLGGGGGGSGFNLSMASTTNGMFGQQQQLQLQQQQQQQLLQQQQNALKGLGLGGQVGGYPMIGVGRPPAAPQALLLRPNSALAGGGAMQQQGLGLGGLRVQTASMEPDRSRLQQGLGQQQGLGLGMGQRASPGVPAQLSGTYPTSYNAGNVGEQQGLGNTLGGGLGQRAAGGGGGGNNTWMSGTGAAMGARQQHARSSIELLQPSYGGQGAGAQAIGGQGLGGGPMAMQHRAIFDSGAGGRSGFMGQQAMQQAQGLGGRQQSMSPGQGFGNGSAQQLSFRGFDGGQGMGLAQGQGLAQAQGYNAAPAARNRSFDATVDQAPRRFAPEISAYGTAPQVRFPATASGSPLTKGHPLRRLRATCPIH